MLPHLKGNLAHCTAKPNTHNLQTLEPSIILLFWTSNFADDVQAANYYLQAKAQLLLTHPPFSGAVDTFVGLDSNKAIPYVAVGLLSCITCTRILLNKKGDTSI